MIIILLLHLYYDVIIILLRLEYNEIINPYSIAYQYTHWPSVTLFVSNAAQDPKELLAIELDHSTNQVILFLNVKEISFVKSCCINWLYLLPGLSLSQGHSSCPI